jgi:hypothetical protein
MADNTDEEHPGNTKNTQSENLSDKIIPGKETETNNPNSETENMEIHHHPDLHHKPKKWKEYFLEFLMIFLAVTMGFFAETIRENISENKQAKELANSLYQEVNADSANVQTVIAMRIKKEQSLKYFINVATDSNLIDPPKPFYAAFAWGFWINTAITFEPNDAILNQLKNSGTLRYFRNLKLQQKIGELGVEILKIRERQQQEYGYISTELRPFVLKYFDFKLLDSVVHEADLSMTDVLIKDSAQLSRSVKILNFQNFNRTEASNVADYYAIMLRSSRHSQFAQYIKTNHELLELLRSEYSEDK